MTPVRCHCLTFLILNFKLSLFPPKFIFPDYLLVMKAGKHFLHRYYDNRFHVFNALMSS